MFAILQNYQEYQWDSFSKIYLNSPFLNLDLAVIGNQLPFQNSENLKEIEELQNGDLDDEDLQAVVKEIKEENYVPNNNNLQKICRESIKDIHSAIFLVEDNAVLKKLSTKLAKLSSWLHETIPKELGIPINKTTFKKKKKVTFTRSLPLKKRKFKLKHANRSGQKAARFKKHYGFDLNAKSTSTKNASTVIEGMQDICGLICN